MLFFDLLSGSLTRSDRRGGIDACKGATVYETAAVDEAPPVNASALSDPEITKLPDFARNSITTCSSNFVGS